MRLFMSKSRKKMKIKDNDIETRFSGNKRDNPFRVPENYFENFAERLEVRIRKEQEVNEKKSLYIILKPFLTMAASFVLILLVLYIPYRKYYLAESRNIVHYKSDIDSFDSAGSIPRALISNFSEEQFMSAFSDMEQTESGTLSSENLADFIAANYNDYEIAANN